MDRAERNELFLRKVFKRVPFRNRFRAQGDPGGGRLLLAGENQKTSHAPLWNTAGASFFSAMDNFKLIPGENAILPSLVDVDDVMLSIT